MKTLLAFLVVSASTTTFACTDEEMAKMAFRYMERAAKDQGAITYVAGPSFGGNNGTLFPFSYRDRNNELQMAYITYDMNTCTSSSWGSGTAKERIVR